MGGRGSASGLTSTPAVTPAAPAAAPAPAPAPVTQPAPAAKPAPAPQPAQVDYGRMPMSEAQYMAQQPAWSAATRTAVQNYLSPHAEPGSMYSKSQILNNSLRKGLRLTTAQQQMMKGLDAGMHDLGYNANMTRYDRIGYMERLLDGRDYTRMTEQQLKAALIGKTYPDKAYVSASHNRFINAPAGNSFQDKAVEIRIHAKSSTKVLMPGAGAGGDFGEMILGRNQNYKIIDVKMPRGQRGRSGPNYYQKVVVTVEVE